MSVNGYTRQSAAAIVTGATIQASHFNNEYNAIETAFSATIGHTHDGTTGGGQQIAFANLSGTASAAQIGLTPTAGAIVYSGSAAIALTAAGSSGQLFASQGTATPIWTTPTYPTVVGTNGQILTSNGTNVVYTTTLPTAAMPALTGDVTNSSGSLATTISANAVSNAKLRQSAGLSVIGTAGSATANVADITGLANQTLFVNAAGTSLGFGTLPVAAGGSGTTTLTANAVILGNGTGTVGFATIGTGGRVLIDQGASANPAFTTIGGDLTLTSAGTATIANSAVTNAKMANMAASTFKGNNGTASAAPSDLTAAQAAALFTNPTQQSFTSGTGTYTTPSNCKYIIVELWGGGGSGGGGNGAASRGVGGSGGGYCRKLITSPSASYSYAVGSGGTAVAQGNAGNSGGNSTFGTALTAFGGNGGNQASGSGQNGVVGGSASGGDENITGGSSYSNGDSTANYISWGGDSPRGGFGARTTVATAGNAPGGGGSAGNFTGSSGAGANGAILVHEYYI